MCVFFTAALGFSIHPVSALFGFGRAVQELCSLLTLDFQSYMSMLNVALKKL